MSSIKGKTLCFTGKLSVTRKVAQATAEGAGANTSSTVTAKTDILVAGGGVGAKKISDAQAKGVDVWTEDQFNAAVAGKKGKKAAKKTKAAAPPEEQPAAKKPRKGKAKAKAAPAPAAAAAAASPAKGKGKAAASTGGRSVNRLIPNAGDYTVHVGEQGDFDVKLAYSDGSGKANNNKFYKIQLLVGALGEYSVMTNWGRLGEPGAFKLKPFPDEAGAIKEFAKMYRAKTKNVWGEPFVRHDDKYELVETEAGEATGDAVLGRLSEAQIHKGQAVLADLSKALKAKDKKAIGQLSNLFNSLIPSAVGRKQPPAVDTAEKVQAKEGLLEFWLRMGFDHGQEQGVGSPIDGVLEMPVPATLTAAASGVADSHSISSSQSRGKALSAKKVGGPVKAMGSELYAAILLYTGNSIYREINRCLRSDWKQVRKYWPYLRILHESFQALPVRDVTLWRGIAADLFDEYVPGKEITWWSISSCTADESVARGFMGHLGGGPASLLTLHCKTACDVRKLSFYPHEAESLLRPGTKLRVLARKRVGTVVEIEVEEVA